MSRDLFKIDTEIKLKLSLMPTKVKGICKCDSEVHECIKYRVLFIHLKVGYISSSKNKIFNIERRNSKSLTALCY